MESDSLSQGMQSYAVQAEQALSNVFRENGLVALHARLAFDTLETLGEGGMGTVYRVRDKRLGRQAALKVLLSEKAPAGLRRRFLREARLTARLDHPSIPPVYEAGLTVENRLYLLMRVIEGQTLSELIERTHDLKPTPEELRQLLEVVVKVSEAVAYAHSQGIIHRDLKPENIMIGEFGEVMVMDWGIARDTSEAEELEHSLASHAESQAGGGLTQVGAFLGTAGYAAPEQIAGEAVDVRADVFALGAILVECLTGRPAIKGADFQSKVMATAAGEIHWPSDFKLAIGGELDWIAREALSLTVTDRTQSAKALVEQLSAYLAGQPVPDYPYTALEQMSRHLRRNPGRWLGSAFVIVVMVGSLALWFRLQNAQERAARESLAGQLRLSQEKAARAEAEGQLRVAKNIAARASKVLQNLNKARELVRRQVSEARVQPLLEEALKLSERSQEVLFTCAVIAKSANKGELAKEYWVECTRRFPPAYGALYELHKLELGSDSFRLTRGMNALILTARERGDENEYTLLIEAIKHFEAKDFDKALACLDKAEEYNRAFPAIYFQKAAIRQNMKQFERAVDEYSKCLAINPRFGRAYYYRGLCHNALKRNGEAFRDFSGALEINPRSAKAYFARADLRADFRDLEGAVADYTRGLEIRPKSYDMLINRGLTLQDLKQAEAAEKDFNAAIRLEPKRDTGYLCRGALIVREYRDYDRGFEDFTKALAINPKNERALLNRGSIYGRRNEPQKALGDYNKALELDPSLSEVYINRAICFEKLGQLSEAVRDYQTFLKKQPKHRMAKAIKKKITFLESKLRSGG